MGTDGSEKADEAVRQAVELTVAKNADRHAIIIVNTARYGEPSLSSTEMVADMEVGLVTKCFHGDPSEEIIDYADAIDADLIVLGSHGRTHAQATIGTASRVLNRANQAVPIVRAHWTV